MSQRDKLISIVTPVYNASDFLEETIQTVLDQTYPNWELILVDDKSEDNSAEIAKKYADKDSRINLIDNNGQNKGPSISRNNGVKQALGRYVAFLDADDLWHKQKLEKQLDFMNKTNATFSCTSYEFADEKGRPNGTKVIVPPTANYNQLITNVTAWTSTVMFDMDKISKEEIEMPDIRIGQDAATWWRVLKNVEYVYGEPEVLAYYRRTNNSLSANKFNAVRRTWNLYRNVEKFSLPKSALYIVLHSYNATKRRLK